MPETEITNQTYNPPLEQSISTLIRYLLGNKVVSNIIRINRQLIQVDRYDKTPITAFLADIYILGITDVHEILSLFPKIDAIIAMSAWNSYTNDAKRNCKSRNIGLFTFKEFLGAIYYEGKDFLDYDPPERNSKNKHSKRK